MDAKKHFESITRELEALKDRVRNFIDTNHWLTVGEWKETVLRSMIKNRLPESVNIGRGFVLTEGGPTTQCDILLFRSDVPVLFRDGDLVFLTPDAVLGVIEVKSKLNSNTYGDAIKKLGELGDQLGTHASHCILGLFSYEAATDPSGWSAGALKMHCSGIHSKVHLVSLGCSHFIRWWEHSPDASTVNYGRWHSYQVDNLAAGYFISNVIDSVCGGKVSSNAPFWFPAEGKETRVIDSFSPSVIA